MPFTPYHFGPGLLAGVLLFPLFDLVAVLIGCVILDIEPMFILFLGLGGPLHGISHTYLVATVVSVFVTGILWLLREPITSIASVVGVIQEPRKIRIFFGSLIGTYSHVFLDSFLYSEMNPFFPLLGNPFLGLVSISFVYDLCVYCGLVGFALYIVRFFVLNRNRPAETTSPFA